MTETHLKMVSHVEQKAMNLSGRCDEIIVENR